MQWGTAWRAAQLRPLLPGSLRGAGIALLAACVAVVAVLAALLAGGGIGGHLDTALDPRIQAWLGRFPTLLNQLPRLGGLPEVTLMTLALALACVVTRRWRGAVLALVAVPGAVGLTEYVLKPYVGGPLDQAFPSGHATSSFALAASSARDAPVPARARGPAAGGGRRRHDGRYRRAHLHRRRGGRRGRHRRGPGLRAHPGPGGQPNAASTSGAI